MFSKLYCHVLKFIVSILPNKYKRALLLRLSDKYRFKSNSSAYTLRYNILKYQGAQLGNNVRIAPGVYLFSPENLKIGNNVSIQHNCYISAFDKVFIGDDVSIGHQTSIITSSHPKKGNDKIRNRKLISEPVIIGNNVWIGMKVSILMGVNVGNNCIVGANSLVNKNIPDNNLAYGSPVKSYKNED